MGDVPGPRTFLSDIMGKGVVVKLNTGVTYHGMLLDHICNIVLFICAKGILASLDGYLNIAMEQTQEYVDGQLKNTFSDTFIRGNNGVKI